VLIVEIHSNDLICIVVSMEDKYMKAKLIWQINNMYFKLHKVQLYFKIWIKI
jgi:hypothetical protein